MNKSLQTTTVVEPCSYSYTNCDWLLSHTLWALPLQTVHYTIVSSLNPPSHANAVFISLIVVTRGAHTFIFTQCSSHEHRGGNHGGSVWIGVTVWCCAGGSGGKVIALCSWDVIERLQPQLPGDRERDIHMLHTADCEPWRQHFAPAEHGRMYQVTYYVWMCASTARCIKSSGFW